MRYIYKFHYVFCTLFLNSLEIKKIFDLNSKISKEVNSYIDSIKFTFDSKIELISLRASILFVINERLC